jgi:myo-inositol-1(or 4)-monophosphatase
MTAGRARSSFLSFAIEAVRTAGEIQLARFEHDVRVRAKGAADIVTDTDIEIETRIRALIGERFPEHRVLGEEIENETALGAGGPAPCWLLDPIDGTVNFAHGLPFFCVSLALEIDGVVEVGAVYEPVRRELFTAERGSGAALNGRRIGVSTTATVGQAVLGTGFPHNATTRVRAMEALLGEAAIRARAVRRLGSAALDLSYVAAGRLDAFWDRDLKPWDTAAGALVVQEAGGVVTDLDGTPFSCHRGGVLASNGALHDPVLQLIRTTAGAEGTGQATG